MQKSRPGARVDSYASLDTELVHAMTTNVIEQTENRGKTTRSCQKELESAAPGSKGMMTRAQLHSST